jgi:hypothetical protein
MLGEWYTPDHLVEYTQNIITTLNTDWRNHLVIDPACGQANLTRDGEFSDLLLSTIRQDEINIILENNYNNGNDVYKIDFLNDDLPDEYIEKIKNAKYVTWYINPPYGTAGKAGATSKSKKGVNKNKINTEMKDSKLIGRAAQQLYVGFIWRITRLMKKYNLEGRMCMFTKAIFMTGSSYKKFRQWFCNKWKFEAGCIMPAPEFGCKGKWPVAFTCWEWGEAGISDRFMLDVVEDGEKIGVQEFYNTDECVSASEWIKSSAKLQKVEGPLQSSGLNFKSKGCGGNVEGMLGDLYNGSNNVYKNAQSVVLYSAGFSSAHNQFIFSDNFLRCITLFTSRKLIQQNWINDKAEYLAPQPTPPLLQFAADSLVYSIFHPSNNMTACRNIMHKGKLYRIKNNLFWHSKNQVKSYCYTKMLEDLKEEEKDPYITNHLCTLNGKYYVLIDDPKICDEPVMVQVSSQAQKVMELADKLWVDSLEKREEYAQEHPEYHLDSWDAGYYQLKYLWREHFPERQKELREAYKELEKQMIPQVYETGFLRRGYERDTKEIKEVN